MDRVWCPSGRQMKTPLSVVELDSLVRELQCLDRDLVTEAAQVRAGPLARPGAPNHPARDLLPLLVEEDNHDVAPRHVALDDVVPPLEECGIAREASPQDGRPELHSPGQQTR